MRYFVSAAALFAATVSADLCNTGSTELNGNFYCKEVKAITYQDVGHAASYNKIVSMDPTTGECTSTPHDYNGTLAPLDQGLSLHLRGPLILNQLAVYTLSSAKTTSGYSKEKRSAHERRHAHGHGHHHHQRQEKRDPAGEDDVEAMINGKLVHFKNTWSGQRTDSNQPKAASPGIQDSSAPKVGSSGTSSSSKSSSYKSSSSSSGSPASGKGWSRVAYYDATKQTAYGMVFLNHQGNTKISGTFDYHFGSSLSYATSDGLHAAPSPEVLAKTTLPSTAEVIVMSDKKCSDDDASCGYIRPGTVGYEGFTGHAKAFFMEFMMPDDGTNTNDIYKPANMPAIWLLNSEIPRTLQYGNAECSCWKTGCGEFDIFEVLAPGDTRCKSTLHSNVAGGDSDFFARPVNEPIKAAVLLFENNIHIKILDGSVEFGNTMPDSFINEIIADTMADSVANLVSLFKLGS